MPDKNIYDAIINEIENQRMLRRVKNRATNYIVVSKPVYTGLRYYFNKIQGRDLNDIDKITEVDTYMDMRVIVLDVDDMTLVVG